MPVFKVLARFDAFVDYIADIEASTADAAVELAYFGKPGIKWEPYGTAEFDACRMVALNEDGEEIESTARGKL